MNMANNFMQTSDTDDMIQYVHEYGQTNTCIADTLNEAYN